MLLVTVARRKLHFAGQLQQITPLPHANEFTQSFVQQILFVRLWLYSNACLTKSSSKTMLVLMCMIVHIVVHCVNARRSPLMLDHVAEPPRSGAYHLESFRNAGNVGAHHIAQHTRLRGAQLAQIAN